MIKIFLLVQYLSNIWPVSAPKVQMRRASLWRYILLSMDHEYQPWQESSGGVMKPM